jgi:hypothetical protein
MSFVVAYEKKIGRFIIFSETYQGNLALRYLSILLSHSAFKFPDEKANKHKI